MKEIDTLFIIDNDPITISTIRKILDNSVRYKTLSTYGNGQLAINGIKKQLRNKKSLPEIIFLDINMPVMDGWQFLEEFVKLPISNSVKINIVTSSIDLETYENWEFYNDLTHHSITFTTKPLNKDKMEQITHPV